METTNQQTQMASQEHSQVQWAPQPAPVNRDERNFRLWRFWLRVIACAFTVVALIVFIAKGTLRSEACGGCRYAWYTFDLLVGLPMAVAALLWDIAEFITYCVNRRGAHPGVHVGLDLVAFLALAIGGGLVVVGSSPASQAFGALLIISSLLHLTLFIMACIATHRRRRSRQKALSQHQAQQTPHPAGLPPPPPGMVYLVPAQSQIGQLHPQAAHYQTYPTPVAAQTPDADPSQHIQTPPELMGNKMSGSDQTGSTVQAYNPISMTVPALTPAPAYTAGGAQTGMPTQTGTSSTGAPGSTTPSAYMTGQTGVPSQNAGPIHITEPTQAELPTQSPTPSPMSAPNSMPSPTYMTGTGQAGVPSQNAAYIYMTDASQAGIPTQGARPGLTSTPSSMSTPVHMTGNTQTASPSQNVTPMYMTEATQAGTPVQINNSTPVTMPGAPNTPTYTTVPTQTGAPTHSGAAPTPILVPAATSTTTQPTTQGQAAGPSQPANTAETDAEAEERRKKRAKMVVGGVKFGAKLVPSLLGL